MIKFGSENLIKQNWHGYVGSALEKTESLEVH